MHVLSSTTRTTVPLHELRRNDAARAGGKGANLGELLHLGIPVPPGFVVTAAAFRAFMAKSGLADEVRAAVAAVDVDRPLDLQQVADRLRERVLSAEFPPELARDLATAHGAGTRAVAVRSSATAEDSAQASFAGMNETFLGVRGTTELLRAVQRCWASLYAPRVIAYRKDLGLDEARLAIAVVVQDMVDSAWAGVMLTQHPDGTKDRMLIEAAPGLGEVVVGGRVQPDRFTFAKSSRQLLQSERGRQDHVLALAASGVEKRSISTPPPPLGVDTLAEIARLGLQIEAHYGAAQDIEFAVDPAGKVWIVQTRPITARAREATPDPAAGAKVLLHGVGSGFGLASGKPVVIPRYDPAALFHQGDVLVARMTTPDWFPLLRKAAAIVTDEGGATSHAAIVARELGIAGVVGTGTATRVLGAEPVVSVDGARGLVLAGKVEAPATARPAPAAAPAPALVTGTEIFVNLSTPDRAEEIAALPVDGVGLVRAETMLLSALGGKHPQALVAAGAGERFVARMRDSLVRLARPFAPRPVVYRTYDFRSNEFAELEGGREYEAVEPNPMLGLRGCARYLRDRTLFDLELRAFAAARADGCPNLQLMLPFVRTGHEIRALAALLAGAGLPPAAIRLTAMAEVPSIVDCLDDLVAAGFHGISIGSNDLTQLLLGVDRDNEKLAAIFDARDPAVVAYLRRLVAAARARRLHTSICGQAPSLHPDFCDLLVEMGIDAISVNPDAILPVRRRVAAAEQRMLPAAARHAKTETCPCCTTPTST